MKIELTLEDVNVILGALAELPFKLSAELIVKVKTQAEEQLKEQEAPVEVANELKKTKEAQK